MQPLYKVAFTLGFLTCVSLPLFAGVDETIQSLNAAWAKARFQSSETEKAKAIDALLPQATALATANPDNPKALVCAATIYGDKAKIIGGLTALSYLKTAKAWYEHAIELDPNGVDGHAHALLGAFYYKTPGWPVAFGDNNKAREYLEKAIRINPKNPESHYFYGDFLRLQGEYEKARAELTTAIKLPARQEQYARDMGRKNEAKEILQAMEDEE